MKLYFEISEILRNCRAATRKQILKNTFLTKQSVEVEVRSLQKNGNWDKKFYRNIEDKVVLTSIDFEMPLRDIYEGIL